MLDSGNTSEKATSGTLNEFSNIEKIDIIIALTQFDSYHRLKPEK